MRTILIIEPDPDSREILRVLLVHHGYRVLESTEPAAGIGTAFQVRPDAIISELFVRTTDGWALLEFLRSSPETTGIPVIVISGHALPDDEARALRSGARQFLSKPVRTSDVLRALVELDLVADGFDRDIAR
jgi:CheY-like chemotaxis protein